MSRRSDYFCGISMLALLAATIIIGVALALIFSNVNGGTLVASQTASEGPAALQAADDGLVPVSSSGGLSSILVSVSYCYSLALVPRTGNPEPTIPVKVLCAHGEQQGRPLPSLSVIYRYLRRQGLDRASLRAGRLDSGPTKAFETPHVNDLWMVDFSPGPTLRVMDKPLPT